jgi:superfamily II DNA or RNA helicase
MVKKSTIKRLAEELQDYTDTVAAIHLLKRESSGECCVSVACAEDIMKGINLRQKPKLGDMVKEILKRAGQPGADEAKWVQQEGQWILEAVIALDGAVYHTRFIAGETKDNVTHYDVQILSELAQKDTQVERGKLYFNTEHQATIHLLVNKTGEFEELEAVTRKGLVVKADSFTPYPFQNETLAKYYESLKRGNNSRLAVMGTGAGKSIIMAGIAQAVGSTVMIVPDKTLVNQQVSEVKKMLDSSTYAKDKPVEKTNVFTFESGQTLFDFEEKTPENQGAIRAYFRTILDQTSNPRYHQIVLEASHPAFHLFAEELNDQMVLIDESHEHTFSARSTAMLKEIAERNAVLALTATPTSRLYEIFPGEPVDNLSLGVAMQIGKARPVKPEVTYVESQDMLKQAVVQYYNDYYLTSDADGYVDPVKIKVELRSRKLQASYPLTESEISNIEKQIEHEAIDTALHANRVRMQRNMGFSDSKQLRKKLTTVYQKIANGDAEILAEYGDPIAEARREAEISARLEMQMRLHPQISADKIQSSRESIAASVSVPQIDLPKEIAAAQIHDIRRTINSYALLLALGEKPDKIAAADRTHKLGSQMKAYDGVLLHHAQDKVRQERIALCHTKTRKSMEKMLIEMIPKPVFESLGSKEARVIRRLILDRAQAIVEKVKNEEPISRLVLSEHSIPETDLEILRLNNHYARVIDEHSSQQEKALALAEIEVGIRTHIVSDHTFATGVSIKEILNVQMLHPYSHQVETSPYAINGTMASSQATGRCVRDSDSKGRVQQFIDRQYEGKGLITTVEDIIHPESEPRVKKVLSQRDMHRMSFRTDQLRMIENPEFVAKTKAIFDVKRTIETLTHQVEEKQLHLQVLKAHLEENTQRLGVTSTHLVELPAHFRGEHDKRSLWYARKYMLKVGEKLESEIQALFEKIDIQKQNRIELNQQRKNLRREFQTLLLNTGRQSLDVGKGADTSESYDMRQQSLDERKRLDMQTSSTHDSLFREYKRHEFFTVSLSDMRVEDLQTAKKNLLAKLGDVSEQLHALSEPTMQPQMQQIEQLEKLRKQLKREVSKLDMVLRKLSPEENKPASTDLRGST